MHLLHLHLLLLYHLLIHLWLLLELALFHCWLFDLFSHGGISHAACRRRGILFLGPLLDLIICACDELVAEVQQDGLSALLHNLSPDALQRVAFHVH